MEEIQSPAGSRLQSAVSRPALEKNRTRFASMQPAKKYFLIALKMGVDKVSARLYFLAVDG
jgi:hypothetical protein